MSTLLEQTSLLVVGIPPEMRVPRECRDGIALAMTAHETISRLRMMSCDLLLTGTAVPDMPWSNMIRRVRTLWPQQRWAMLAPQLAINDEVTARALGAISILQQWPDADVLRELTARRLAAVRRIAGPHKHDQPSRQAVPA